jgi:hypothetical protein
MLATVLALSLAMGLTPANAAAGGDTLNGSTNETLYGAQNQSLFSPSRGYEARMQSDGNFVLYGPSGPLWATYTHGSSNSRLVMQSDGNLVIYDGGTVLYASGTGGSNARLVMQDDGNLVLYSNGTPIWGTYTNNGASKMPPAGAVAFAKAQLGKWYQYGATGPNTYDCSGLTLRAYGSVGVTLPRTSQEQYKRGVTVSRPDLQPGDLTFYRGIGTSPGHVAIYIGNGQIVEALTTGTQVRIDSLDYPGGYVGARRVA